MSGLRFIVDFLNVINHLWRQESYGMLSESWADNKHVRTGTYTGSDFCALFRCINSQQCFGGRRKPCVFGKHELRGGMVASNSNGSEANGILTHHVSVTYLI